MSFGNDDATLLPWQLIAEFLSLKQILSCRLVSRNVKEAIQDLSPQKCGALLEQTLLSRNICLLHGSWDHAIHDNISISDALIRDSDHHTTPMETMLRIFRVLKHLPMEVAVAFNGKYGRHCVPLKFASETNQTEPVLCEPCSRRDCATCNLRIPPCEDSNAKIYKYISVPNEKNETLDLNRFYNKCVPNLPSGIICPFCRNSDERTLVISTVSYPSASASTGQTALMTYTPCKKDDSESDTDDNKVENECQEPKRKRQRFRQPASFAFPDMYEDLSLPTKWGPLERARNSKHGIAIHCVVCQNFGVVAPAGPCCDSRFPCQERTRQVMVGKDAATMGGLFVRRRCSNQDCLNPVSCESCSREVNHPVYERDVPSDGTDTQTTVAHMTRCLTCSLRYCNDCAWLSTICHHW